MGSPPFAPAEKGRVACTAKEVEVLVDGGLCVVASAGDDSANDDSTFDCAPIPE